MIQSTKVTALQFSDTLYRVMTRDGILSFSPPGVSSKTLRPTVFLDRDGVLNQRIPGGYVTRWADFVFLPGVIGALVQLKVAGFQLVIVSNQAGVAKGIFTCADLIQLTEPLLGELQAAGVFVEGAFFCLHMPSDACPCRKPNVGLLKEAGRILPIDFSRSFLIGDSPSDIQAGARMDCTTISLCGDTGEFPSADYRAENINDAVAWLIGRRS
jgi:histidinol-phosphate phosphatase family protein